MPAAPGSGVMAPPEEAPSIQDFYDKIVNPETDLTQEFTDTSLTPEASPGSGVLAPPEVEASATETKKETTEPVTETEETTDTTAGGTGTDTSGETADQVWAAAQGAIGVDATKRRRRRSGYGGTVLTGPLGIGSESTGKTILG